MLQVGTGSTVGHPASLLPALSPSSLVQESGKSPDPPLLCRMEGACLAPRVCLLLTSRAACDSGAPAPFPDSPEETEAETACWLGPEALTHQASTCRLWDRFLLKAYGVW